MKRSQSRSRNDQPEQKTATHPAKACSSSQTEAQRVAAHATHTTEKRLEVVCASLCISDIARVRHK